MVTLFLAGFPDFLSPCGRLTGAYPCTYAVVSFLCFRTGFLLWRCVVFPYLDFAFGGSSNFSASMGCEHNENRLRRLRVYSELMSYLWLKSQRLPSDYQQAVNKRTTSVFHWCSVSHGSHLPVTHWFTVALWAGRSLLTHTQSACDGVKHTSISLNNTVQETCTAQTPKAMGFSLSYCCSHSRSNRKSVPFPSNVQDRFIKTHWLNSCLAV